MTCKMTYFYTIRQVRMDTAFPHKTAVVRH